MIVHSDLTEQDVGRKVIYEYPHGSSKKEEGVITSYNKLYVFVRYGSDFNSKATLAKHLTFQGDMTFLDSDSWKTEDK